MRIKISRREADLLKLFSEKKRYLRTSEAIRRGFDSRYLYSLVEKRKLVPFGRGIFKLRDLPEPKFPKLLAASVKVPQGVISGGSALTFHGLTTHIFSDVHLSLMKGAKRPKIFQPSITFFWISEPVFSEAIEVHKMDGAELRVYSAEKAIADCFKFRSRIGIKVCIEALRTWTSKKNRNTKKLMHHAKSCRVEKIIRPYLDAMTL